MSTFETFELRERTRIDAELLHSLSMSAAEYEAAPEASERDGMTPESLEAENREAEAASARLKQITATRRAAKDARWEQKQITERARRARHKGKARKRKDEPTRKVRAVVITLVSLEQEKELENRFENRA
jgi:hypothetical protein